MYAAVGTESTAEEGEIRRPVNLTSYVIKKNPIHGARHGPTMRQCTYYKAHGMLKKARYNKNGYKIILDRWNNDDKYYKLLSDVLWTEERVIQYGEIALEDHSCIATQQETSRNEKSRKLSLNAEGIQGQSAQ